MQEQSWWAGYMKGGSSCLTVPLNNDILLLRCPGLLPQTFLILQILTAVPSGCLFTANSSLFPGSALQTHFPGPRPPLQQAIQGSSWDTQGCSIDHARSSHLALPSTDHPLWHPPWIPQKSFSVPADISTIGGVFQVWGPPFTFSTPLLSLLDSSFFLSFLLPSCQGIFLVLLGVPSFLLVFSRCSVNCSICRCTSDVLVRRDKFHVLLFGHLDSSTSYTC